MDQAVARLVSTENLAKTLTEPNLLGRQVDASRASDVADRVRESVRVDIRAPDEAGVQEVRIRWVGDPHERIAGRVVTSLCRQLAAGLTATGLGAADSAETRDRYETARSELIAAETALASARAEFEAALSAPGGARRREFTPESRKQTIASTPAKALPNVTEADETQLARQRLAELEQRRETLADRLMPEHPDMKALGEKIEDLRSAIARRPAVATPPRAPIAELPIDNGQDAAPDEKWIARSGQLWQAVIEAENRYAAALAQEREHRQSLVPPRGRLVAEIDSTRENAPPAARAAWRGWLLSGLTGLLAGGLVLALWPSRRQTFANAEEVRAVTRLPVVVLESASLN
jgi:hypothetical protein